MAGYKYDVSKFIKLLFNIIFNNIYIFDYDSIIEDVTSLYVPTHCINSTCGHLLAPSFMEARFIISQIEKFKYYLKVVFLGSNLHPIVNKLMNLKSSDFNIIVLYRSPSLLINSNKNYYEITMPRCNEFDEEFREKYGCKYESTMLLKYGSRAVTQGKGDTRFVDHLTKYIYFTQSDIDSLLKMTAESDSNIHDESLSEAMHNHQLIDEIESEYNRIANVWITNNLETVLKWLPSKATLDERNVFIIGGMFPELSDNISPLSDVMNDALERINSNELFLPNVALEPSINLLDCEIENTLKTAINWFSGGRVLSMIGPQCNEELEIVASRRNELYFFEFILILFK